MQLQRLRWRGRHWKLASLPGICYWSNPSRARLCSLQPFVRSFVDGHAVGSDRLASLGEWQSSTLTRTPGLPCTNIMPCMSFIRWRADFASHAARRAMGRRVSSADLLLLSLRSVPTARDVAGRTGGEALRMRVISQCSGAMKMQRWPTRCWRSACFALACRNLLAMLFEPA